MTKPDKTLSVSFAISLFVHTVFFVFLSLGYNIGLIGAPQGSSRYEGFNVDVIPKEKITKIEVKIEEKENNKKTKIVIRKPKKRLIDADKECPNKWYGGIGIRNGWDPVYGTEYIIEVFSGYAADLAGLMSGDIILWIDDKQIIGPPGTTLTMKIKRGEKVFYVKLTRVKVCY